MVLRQHWKAALFLCVLVAGLMLAVNNQSLAEGAYPEAAIIGQGVGSFDELSARFVDLAQKKGAVYAFDVLRVAPLPPDTDLHLLGHAIGDELYKQKGVAGIADCTQDFRNACSHAVVIGALNEYGAGDHTLALIDQSCHQAPGGSGAYTMCYHGLGHGVFAYFGYDLEKTDAFCKRMGTKEYGDEQYTQCVGGAIMELMGGGGHDHDLWVAARAKYLTQDPLSPCDGAVVPEDAKTFCYMYLTPRLFELAGAELAHPDPATFPKAFSFCDALPQDEARQRDACFGGFGKEFIPLAGARDIRAVDRMSDDEYRLAASWCSLSAARDGKAACIGQALESVFWGGENDPGASFRFCGLVPGGMTDACYAKLSDDIGRYLSGDARAHWCGELSAQYQDSCALTDSSHA